MLRKDYDRYRLLYHERRFPAVLQLFSRILRRIGGALDLYGRLFLDNLSGGLVVIKGVLIRLLIAT